MKKEKRFNMRQLFRKKDNPNNTVKNNSNSIQGNRINSGGGKTLLQLMNCRDPYFYYNTVPPLRTVVDKIADAIANIEIQVKDIDKDVFIDNELSDYLKSIDIQTILNITSVDYLLTSRAYYFLGGNIDYSPVKFLAIPSYYTQINQGAYPYINSIQLNNTMFSGLYNMDNDYNSFIKDDFNEVTSTLLFDTVFKTSKINALTPLLDEYIDASNLSVKMINNGGATKHVIQEINDETINYRDDTLPFQLRAEQMQQSYMDTMNSQYPMYLGEEVKITPLGSDANKMELDKKRIAIGNAVASAYGLNTNLFEQSTYDNQDSAKKSLYQDVALHILKELLVPINDVLLRRFNLDSSKFIINPNENSIPTLREYHTENILSLTGVLLTVNESRAKMGLPPLDDTELENLKNT